MNRAVAALVVAFAFLAAGSTPSGQSPADPFDSSALQRVDLWANSLDWEKLKQNFQANDYYPADLAWNGQTVRNVGIRSRGVASRSGTKPGLKVEFDHYATDQRFLNLKSLVLDNLTQDASGVHETVTMWLFAKMGIPAPREAHTRLYVNGEYAGLYVATEPVDKVMLARVFGSNGDDVLNDGYLYEFDKADVWLFTYLGSDLDLYKLYFQAKTHEKESEEDQYRLIETLVRLANEKPASELVGAIGGYLDLKQLVRYVAVQNFVAETDGFLGQWGMNNFYLYRLEHSTQHVLIPWDEDLAFSEPTFDVSQRLGINVLVSRLMEIPEYRALYFSTLKETADLADARTDDPGAGILEIEIRRQLSVIDEAMRADTFKAFADSDVTLAGDLMKQFAPARIRFVTCEVARQTGAPVCQAGPARARP